MITDEFPELGLLVGGYLAVGQGFELDIEEYLLVSNRLQRRLLILEIDTLLQDTYSEEAVSSWLKTNGCQYSIDEEGNSYWPISGKSTLKYIREYIQAWRNTNS